MAAQNQVDLGSLLAVPKLHKPNGDINEDNNARDNQNLTRDRCRTRVPIVSILACKLKSFWCVGDHGQAPREPQRLIEGETDEEGSFHHTRQGGWKTMPFIIGNAACEYLATLGFVSNLIIYLIEEFHMASVTATYVINMSMGLTNFTPLLGAFISDSYLSRYWTISLGSIVSVIGLALLSLTAIFPQFRPPPCNPYEGTPCRPASRGQNALLYSSFIMMSIGAGGIRPCSLAFGADQLDYTSEKGKRSIQSYFNWTYFSVFMSVVVGMTALVYIQAYISWGWGFGIPTILMFLSVTSLLVGKNFFIRVTPEGRPFTSLLQVLVAAGRKRHLSLPSQTSDYHDPPQKSKVALTDQFMFVNKASIKVPQDFKEDGPVAHPWRLCSLQQVEELKSVIRVGPIWLSMISFYVCLAQLNTFSVYQAETMDRHVGKHFQIPAGSFSVFNVLAAMLFLPIYDRLIVPFSKRMTKEGRGITTVQRMGVGYALATVSMAVAAVVETKRRNVALSHGFIEKPEDVIPMSALWLVPQYSLGGLVEAFSVIGGIEFLYSQFPENLRTVGIALLSLSAGVGNYLSSLIVSIVHQTTGGPGQNNWLAQNLNKGKLDNFYWVIAGYNTVSLLYFVIVARWYTYKATADDQTAEESITAQENHIFPEA